MINDKKNLRDDEDAVSPVIGVILMVAITVIMAAVIGAFVYGYGGSMEQSKDVSFIASHQGSKVIVTYMGGPDQNLVQTITPTVKNDAGTSLTTSGTATSVGDTVSFASADVIGKNHVIVVVTFTDGSEQVVLDTYC